jgi:hypothetical protein
VREEPILEFSVTDLYHAMDRQRLEHHLTWSQAARDIWELSSELNARRNDHPISPATLTGMAQRGSTSCQHALFFLRWLQRSPESFLEGGSPLEGGLPEVGSDRRLRWRLTYLYEAMNVQRRDRGMTWSELATLLRCTTSQLTGLRTAKYATGIKLAMRITQWLDRPAADFIYAAKW